MSKVDLSTSTLFSILLIPLSLVFIHLLPRGIRNILIFNHQDPEVLAAFSTHFVHSSNGHLLGNLFIALTALVFLSYFFINLGMEKKFRRCLGISLLGFPFLISLSEFLIFNAAGITMKNSLGFSAIALALVGTIPPTLFLYLKETRFENLNVADSVPFFHLGLVFILSSYILLWLNSSVISFGLEIMAVIGVSAVFLFIYSEYRLLNIVEKKLGLSSEDLKQFVSTNEGKIVGMSLLVFVFGAFAVVPSQIAKDGGMINIISHMVGFTMGFYTAELFLVKNKTVFSKET